MKYTARLLLGVGAIALAACSDTGESESGPDASPVGATETASPNTEIDALGDPAEALPTLAPTSVTGNSGDPEVRPGSRARQPEPARQPPPGKPAPAPSGEPSPAPSPTCAPEHRELGHC